MTNQSSHQSFPILTNLNWLEWKISIEGYMKQHNLYSFISQRVVPPANTKESKAFETCKMKASGVLQQYMGMVNYQKFETITTKKNP
jgi:hypothetical protein